MERDHSEGEAPPRRQEDCVLRAFYIPRSLDSDLRRMATQQGTTSKELMVQMLARGVKQK